MFVISGLPWRRMAPFKASMHRLVSSVVDGRQAKTFRLDQSSTATRQTKPRAIHCQAGDLQSKSAERGNVGHVHGPDLGGACHRQLSWRIEIDFVARCQFRRVRLATRGLDAYPLHACGHMQPRGGKVFLAQKDPSSFGCQHADTSCAMRRSGASACDHRHVWDAARHTGCPG